MHTYSEVHNWVASYQLWVKTLASHPFDALEVLFIPYEHVPVPGVELRNPQEILTQLRSFILVVLDAT